MYVVCAFFVRVRFMLSQRTYVLPKFPNNHSGIKGSNDAVFLFVLWCAIISSSFKIQCNRIWSVIQELDYFWYSSTMSGRPTKTHSHLETQKAIVSFRVHWPPCFSLVNYSTASAYWLPVCMCTCTFRLHFLSANRRESGTRSLGNIYVLTREKCFLSSVLTAK